MPEFRKSNGLYGLDRAYHTATGYECVANHPGNNTDQAERVVFYAKHVVGADGNPYTEVGLSGLLDSERDDAVNHIKDNLKEAGFSEVDSLTDADSDSDTFMEHRCTDFDCVSVRVCAGKQGISKVVDVIGKMILDTSRSFVKEQEKVPNVLVESILAAMGDEMIRGPGGKEMAIEKAKDLAYQFENGVSEMALMS